MSYDETGSNSTQDTKSSEVSSNPNDPPASSVQRETESESSSPPIEVDE